MFFESLKMYLPAYLLVFFSIIFLWEKYSKRNQTLINPIFNKADFLNVIILNKIVFTFKIIILLIFLIVLVFCYFSVSYSYLYPIEVLNQSLIIGIGFHLLKIVLIFLIFVQVFLDKIAKHSYSEKKRLKLFYSYHDKLLIVFLLIIVCFSLMVSNVFSLLLSIFAFTLYLYKHIKIRQVETTSN